MIAKWLDGRGWLARVLYWNNALGCCGHAAWMHVEGTRLCRRWFRSEWDEEIKAARQKWLQHQEPMGRNAI